MFKPCIVIPVYNHARGLQSMIGELERHQLPCILVDDGSDADCAAAVAELAAGRCWMSLLKRRSNGGKGAAVCDGLRQACRQGYTHALQVDADGQHDLDDIPRFMQLSQQAPGAVISAVRIYDSVPAHRRYGRFATDIWVWINTLSFTISDSMCGYRLYPLAATIQLLNNTRIGRRMDFDTDILVRLYWQGLEVKQLASKVRYHDDIVSHFDLWRDNARISLMHTRLFFGMLRRLPRLLMRNFRNQSQEITTPAK